VAAMRTFIVCRFAQNPAAHTYRMMDLLVSQGANSRDCHRAREVVRRHVFRQSHGL